LKLYFIGNINKAQENILQALDISNKYNLLDIQQVCKCVLGEIYKEQGKFEQAIKLLDESLSNLIYKMNEMACLVSLVETKKMAGYIYNSELDRLTDIVLKANYITFIENYQLFLVLEDTPYLETAYNQVQEKADNLEPEVAAKFLSYPIPKAIVEEWEKVTAHKN
jgi:tetratricopeptide (TPR) repeat protein